jgi:hypothetical protein
LKQKKYIINNIITTKHNQITATNNMPCFYPKALLAMCKAYSLDENDPDSPREFIECLLMWMHENYGDASSIYNDDDSFNVIVPSNVLQKEIYDWFMEIKQIFEFETMNEVVNWFYNVNDECDIDLGFNMLRVKDQKNFIKYYDDFMTEEIPDSIPLVEINSPAVTEYIANWRSYGTISDADTEEVSDADTEEVSDADTEEVDSEESESEESDEEFELPENVTVRRGIRRTLDFGDDFVNSLAEEAATERENAQNNANYDSDSSIGSIPELEGFTSDSDVYDDFSDGEFDSSDDENEIDCHHLENTSLYSRSSRIINI